ncbi:MAG: tRNA (guanosine(37)-N1)-methyltransferase TrmD [Terrimicrobiaceae bacterium]
MKIQILTIFPEICEAVLGCSILGRARKSGLVQAEAVDLRPWASGKHRTTDDAPYGGGPGMVMKIEPIFRALSELKTPVTRVVLMSPQGRPFTQATAERLAREQHLLFVCGHYEGVDQRVADHLVDEEISIGDYVLTNGALAAMVVTDAVVRLLPGVLGHSESAVGESFSTGILDHPHYTRPEIFQDWRVPDVLLSGDHGAIARWRAAEAQRLTRERRPELLDAPSLTEKPTV